MGTNTVNISFPSPEDGNRTTLRNVEFSSYLEFRTMDEFLKLSDSDQKTDVD
jgi:hypothetical protein